MKDHPKSGEGSSLARAELLARFVPACDPLDSSDLSQISRQLEDLRISLRTEGADLEDALCGLADRILELIGQHGHIAGRQALDLILEIVEQVRTAVGGDPTDGVDLSHDPLAEDPLEALLPRRTLGLRLMDQRRLGESRERG